MADSDTQKVADLAKNIDIAMLTTIDEDGGFISRPMAQQEVEFDGDLWFYTFRESRKVAHITTNPHVSVTLSSHDTWVSINGTAEVVDDAMKAQELWNARIEAWLPQGPDDENVVLVKVSAESAEYWDTPGGTVATVLSFVKAKVTGEPADVSDTGKVDL